MSDGDNANYYLLLELDPEVDDWAVIETALKERRRSWTLQKNQGAPSARRDAERHLKLIPDIEAKLKDPTQRRAMAQGARKARKDARTQRFAKLDELIGVLDARTATAEQVKLLVTETKLSEAEVVTRLKERGLSVGSGAAPKQRPKERPKLDRTVENSIRDNLRHVGKASLYELLEMSHRSSPKSLYDAGDELYKALYRKGARDADSTARQELAGHCMVIFKDAEQKQRYDNTLAAEAMQQFDAHLNLLGQGDKFLDQKEVDKLVRDARRKHVDANVALEYIEEFAAKRNWVVQRGANLPSAQLKACGFCEALARALSDERCHACGQELIQACPRCGEPTPTQDECCRRCGCSTGDAQRVRGLLREGQDYLVQGELRAAQAAFDRALLYWPDWKPALEGKQNIESRRHSRETALEAIDRLVRDRKMEQARSGLERFQREYGAGGTEELKRRIHAGIESAAQASRAADALAAAGHSEQAVDKYSEALAQCADFQPAVRALAAAPPPPPAALKVALNGATAQLAWEPASARGSITYHVGRKAGGPPTTTADGIRVCEAPICSHHESELPAGTAWYYAVFTLRSGVASVRAATSGPHLRLADATHVLVEAGDAQVSLRWTRPSGCLSVEVWREQGRIPAAAGQGVRVTVSGDSAIDQGLNNGSSYGYLIVAGFADPRPPRNTILAPGVGVLATPVMPPPPVMDLRARRTERTVELSWTPLSEGDVQVRQAKQLPALAPGQILSLAAADRFGVAARATGRGSAQAALESQGRVFFVPLSIVADTAVVGTAIAVTTLDEVTGLKAQRQGNAVHLTWTWPSGASDVLVGWRNDRHPTCPEDSLGGRHAISRKEYDRRGFCELRDAPRARYAFSVFVWDREGGIYSAGVQVVEATGLEAQVVYRVVNRRSLFGRSLQAAWVELRTKDLHELPAIQAVLRAGTPPIRPEDGRLVASIESLSFADGAARIELPIDGASGFIKLFFKDARYAREIRLMPEGADQTKRG